MVTLGTYLHVADNSGVRLVSCVKILGNTYKKNAKLGDLLIVSIKRVKKSVPFIKAKRRR
jgi:large subunit ribosomal protein L14